MKKQKLNIKFERNIVLFAISAPMKDHRFIWNLNKYLNLHFCKREPYINYVADIKREFNIFSDENIKDVFFIGNKFENFSLFNSPGIDFFLISKEPFDNESLNYWTNSLKSLSATTFVKHITDDKIIKIFRSITEEIEYQETDRIEKANTKKADTNICDNPKRRFVDL